MLRGRKTALTLHLTPAERRTLLAWQQSPTIPPRFARRAWMILLLAEGDTISDIARTVGVSRRNVYKWVQRFRAERLAGLYDKAGPGRRREPSPDLREHPDNLDVG